MNACDVAIVGFGPSGAVAAGLLGQAGLEVYACEKLPGVYEIPRAIALDHEIMRVFQQLGVVDAIQPYCEPFTPSEYFGVDGQLIRRMTMVEPPYPQGYTPSIVFSQPPVERVLRERVARMPNVRVELSSELQGLQQDAEGATLSVRHADGTLHSLRAKYVIACDGGASFVRTRLDLPLEDLDFDEPWLVVDVLVNERGLAKLPKVSVQYCEPERPCTLVIGPKNHRRWEISLKPGEDPKEAATPERTWELLSRWLTPEDGQLWRQASYRFHALVAAHWRKGRVFLAGDAAHLLWPLGGFGMNTAIGDAVDLAWKLAAVLRGDVQGRAAEALLDSYGTERKAHVRELTIRIKGVGAVICERDPAKARARDARLLDDCGGVVQDTPRQDILPRLEGGFLAARDTTGRGTLFPQPRLAASRALMDHAVGGGWRLVLAQGAGLQQEVPRGITIVALARTPEADGVVARWMQRHACCAALVRPDHYVYGTASSATETAQLLADWRQRVAQPEAALS
jgi:3-(3-hydroxy-phenyl)propionate hydroxylase